MRSTAITIALIALGCASGAQSWVRADGSDFSDEQLQRDVQRCFPTTPQMGPGSSERKRAEDCMYNRGWRRPGS